MPGTTGRIAFCSRFKMGESKPKKPLSDMREAGLVPVITRREGGNLCQG